ncbi:MAG: hypothetical protein JW909_07995 [Planctomycetes bacterium]|nr:hypothetical protein [Planctomycetota bacterium]
MSLRDRFNGVMHYREVDRMPFFEFGYWAETLSTWHEQGLPEEVNDEATAYAYFGIEVMQHAPFWAGFHPLDKAQVLEETDEYVLVRDGDHVVKKELKQGIRSIPHYVEFPLKTRDDWKWYKERLNPDEPVRYGIRGGGSTPPDPAAIRKELAPEIARLNDGPFPVAVQIGSICGWIRNLMGFEDYAVATIADPAWVTEMMEDITNCIVGVLETAFSLGLKADAGAGWEDICFNSGPIIHPDLFYAEAVPRYKRIMDVLHKNGCDIAYTDCDGNITALTDGWMEAGINCMFPVEVHGGTDPVALRERYGKDMRFLGGVDKMVLQTDKTSIKKELERLRPAVEEGGFIPHVDHRCQPSVPYENYLYYLDTKREMFNAGRREPMY